MRDVETSGICVVEDSNYRLTLAKQWRTEEAPSPRHLYCVSDSQRVAYVLAESQEGAKAQVHMDEGHAARLPLFVRGWGSNVF
jgi:hypothetical protein